MQIWELPHRFIGRRVEVFDQAESTNSMALERCRDAGNSGLALIAREQTAGRGQYGRSWQAPAGSSVLLSAILFPPLRLRRPALLTAFAAVSVCQLIEQISGLEATIKWPNDVLANGKKLCGILIEQRGGPGQEEAPGTVIGIGLNVRQSASFFLEADLPLGGSIYSLTGKELESDDVARQLLAAMDSLYTPLADGGTPELLEAQWARRLGLLGRIVTAFVGEVARTGRLRTCGFDSLEIVQDTGAIVRLAPESVRRLELHIAP